LLDLKSAQHGQDQSTATPLEFRDTPKNTSETELQAALLAKKDTEIVEALLNPITKHTALVKVQGPFSPRQIASIAEGLVYLERLGLVSIVVVDDESWTAGGFMGASSSHTRKEMQEAALALTEAFESIGGKACPLISNIFKLGDVSDSMASSTDNHNEPLFHTSTCVSTLEPLRAAIARGEMPIITPIAVDSGLSAVAVPANDAIKALVASLAREGHVPPRTGSDVDLLPLRMMIINREGGIPSPARGGAPHLSINLESEYDYIQDTFVWQNTHPTSLSNLNLLRSCLFQLPRESSAVIVSHRSPKALIANLITNRPAFSPSLHYSVLPVKQIQHMPTIVRRGLPIRVIRDFKQINLDKCTRLLEASFRQTLNADSFYGRLAQDMDFIIVAGEAGTDSDYQAAAIVTKERDLDDPSSSPISYLDKFAVLPSLQGDGTVDFMWTALRDETFGLGLLDALNPNGGKQGFGFGTDLVWRSRADNPVNKWYSERSNGFVHIPEMGSGGVKGTLFWCDAEDRLVRQMEASAALSNEGRASERQSISIVMKEEEGRLARWARVIGNIGSCWVHK
jgi:amino-acid N-acetyltransferase